MVDTGVFISESILMRQIDLCNYWQKIKSETPDVIEYLAVDTTLSPEIVDFLGGANELLPEVELERVKVPRALDDYELAMIA